jgi:hypothetical protein
MYHIVDNILQWDQRNMYKLPWKMFCQTCLSDHIYQAYCVALILISLYSAFYINLTCILGTTCLMWPYFNIPLEGHIRQVWLYIYHVLSIY